MAKNEKKRKTSFLRKLYEKLNPSAPTEPEDPGEDVSIVEEVAEEGTDEKTKSDQEQNASTDPSVIFDLNAIVQSNSNKKVSCQTTQPAC